MKTWEYRTMEPHDEDYLKKLGLEGWQGWAIWEKKIYLRRELPSEFSTITHIGQVHKHSKYEDIMGNKR